MWRRKREQDLERELRSHIECEAEDQGHSFAARRTFGNLARVKEDVREAWGWTWIERIGQDLRYALRTMRQNPGFTATAVLSLALGIGANTAIFSLIDALMLRWLPVRNPQELVQLRLTGSIQSFSYPVVRALSDRKEVFAGVAGFNTASFEAGPPSSIARVTGAWVTGEFYQTLGLNPSLGRVFAREDDEPGAPLVAVISHGYSERQFARNPDIVGQPLLIAGVPVTIIGVSPPGFAGATVGSIADITMPVAALPRVTPESAPLLGPGNFWLRILTRPKPGLSNPVARARLNAAWPAVADEALSPAWPAARRNAIRDARFELTPGATGYTYLRERFRKPLLVLMAVVSLVLLIACLNVANLLLARAAARQREIAVRLAMGAGRKRVVRQLLTESLLLASLGGILGLGLAWPCSRFLVDLFSTGTTPVSFDLSPNWRVLLFTAAASMITALLFGLAPALQSTSASGTWHLKSDPRMSGSRPRLLSCLVSIQVALSLLLLIGAGLFVRTLRNLQTVDPGFRSEGVFLVNLDTHQTPHPELLVDDLRELPGVVSAAISTHTPLSGSTWTEPAVPRGRPMPDHDTAIFSGVGPAYFATMRVPLLAGRDFTERDSGSAPSVAVISEAFAARYFAGSNPLGEYLSASFAGRKPIDLEIVGIVKDVAAGSLRRAPYPSVYVPYAQVSNGSRPDSKFAWPGSTLEILGAGSLAQVAEAVRAALQSKLARTLVEVRPLSAQVDATIVQERLVATLASGFGVLALILACVGLYGLLAYSVQRRTKEIGIRMALGAQRKGVIAIVIKSAVRLVVMGLALGLPAAWLALRSIQSMLFGLTSTDPATIVAAAATLTAAALIASYLPARRASRVDPMRALRQD